ncbi:MAG: polysaccharide deacetylase family protein [Desulfosoma sp.]
MLIVRTPESCLSERTYIFGVVLGEFLGLTWRLETDTEAKNTTIRLPGQPGEIVLPETFFPMCEHLWLKQASLPARPLPRWNFNETDWKVKLTDKDLPVIYGDPLPEFRQDEGCWHLPIDIFGSAFFMLSRYEEVVVQERDEHDRFPARASLAYQEGFLDRPIVDEYVEILWAAMKRLWPGLERKPRQRTLRITCDVDSAYKFESSLNASVRGLAGDLLKRRDPKLAACNLHGRWRARRGDFRGDPWLNAIRWMMDVNEKEGNRVSFFFMTAPRHKLDGRYSIQEPVVRRLLRHIHERGHRIGLHPGYSTYLDCKQTEIEADLLRRTLDEESIPYGELGGRQHYLRWRTPETARNWEVAGMTYDSTLSYADHAGFRCGTSREYSLYDLCERRPLEIKERPLIVMECSVISERYMGLGLTESAFSFMQTLKERALSVGGEFTLLWHNTELQEPEARRFYQELIRP